MLLSVPRSMRCVGILPEPGTRERIMVPRNGDRGDEVHVGEFSFIKINATKLN